MISIASELDEEIENIPPSHVIALRYKTINSGLFYIPWHKDNGDNDGLKTAPIVSISIGDSCEFLVCNEKPVINSSHPITSPVNLSHRIKINSGDVLVFGGKSREIFHSIHQVFENTAPPQLPLESERINLTCRHTPHLFGREDEFSKIPKNIGVNNQFYRLIE